MSLIKYFFPHIYFNEHHFVIMGVKIYGDCHQTNFCEIPSTTTNTILIKFGAININQKIQISQEETES